MRAVALAVLFAGCLPVPHETSRTIDRLVESAVPGRGEALVVHTDRYGGLVVVTAAWPRRCTEPVVDRVETTQSTEPTLLGTSDGDLWGWFVFGIPLMVFFPIGAGDAAITLAVVAVADSSTTVHTES